MARRKRNPLYVQGKKTKFDKPKSLQTAVDDGVKTYTTAQKSEIGAATARYEQRLGATLTYGIESSLDEYKQELSRRIEEQKVIIPRLQTNLKEAKARLKIEESKRNSPTKTRIVNALNAGIRKATADIKDRKDKITGWKQSFSADVETQKRRLELEQGFSEEAKDERKGRVSAYRERYTQDLQKKEAKRIRDSVYYTSPSGAKLDSQGIAEAIIKATQGVQKNFSQAVDTYEEYSNAAYDTAIDSFWRKLSNDAIQKVADAKTSEAIAIGIQNYFFGAYTLAIKGAQAGELRRGAVQLTDETIEQTGFISALRQLYPVTQAYDWLKRLFGGRIPSSEMIDRSNAILASQGKPLIPSVPNLILDALIGKPIKEYKIQSAIVETTVGDRIIKERITYLSPTGDLWQYSGTIINKVGMDTGAQLPRKGLFQRWNATKKTQQFLAYLKPTIVAIRIFELNSYKQLAVDQTSQSDLLSGLERVSDDQLQAGPKDVMAQRAPEEFKTVTPYESRETYYAVEKALFVSAHVIANLTVKSVRAFLEVPQSRDREGIYADSRYIETLESELQRLDKEDARPYGYDTLRDQSFSKILEMDERLAAEREAYAAADKIMGGDDGDDYYDDDDDFGDAELNNNPLVTNQSLLLQQNTAYILLNLIATLFMNRNVSGIAQFIQNEIADNATEIKSGIKNQSPLKLYEGVGALNPQGNSYYARAKAAICKRLLTFFQYHMYEILFKDMESDIIRRYRQLNSKDGKFDRRYAQQYAESYVEHRRQKAIKYIESYEAWFDQYDERSMDAMCYNGLGYTYWGRDKENRIILRQQPFLFPNKTPIPYNNPLKGRFKATQDGTGTPFFDFLGQHRTQVFVDIFLADKAVMPIKTPLGKMQLQIRELLGPFIGLPPGVTVDAYYDQSQNTVNRVLYYCAYGVKKYYIPKLKDALRE